MAQRAAPSKRTRAILATLTAAALAVGGAIFATQAQAAAGNLLANGNFGSGLSGWTCDAGTASVVTSPVYSGDTDALAGAASSSDDAQCTQTVSVQPNSSYTLSGEVEGSYVFIGVTSGTDNWTPSATTWQQLSTTFTTTASQTSVTVYVHGWYGEGTYYADNLSLLGAAGAGSTSTSPTPTTTTTTTPTPDPDAHADLHPPAPRAGAAVAAACRRTCWPATGRTSPTARSR
jgi:hypothetical protein